MGFRLLDGVSVWQGQDDAVAEAWGDGGEEAEGSGDKSTGDGEGKAKGKATRVPGSKEEVFKDKSVSLVDKRRLMRFLMFVAGEYERDAAYAGRSPSRNPMSVSFHLEAAARTCVFALASADTPKSWQPLVKQDSGSHRLILIRQGKQRHPSSTSSRPPSPSHPPWQNE